ncbi:MAG TPA: VC0807 family protein [Acidimicrobiales bacterium]|nr:VC0807 family protein [Acidimicrobiales bacterium]
MHHPPLEIPRLRALARHALPNLVEASLVPLAVFYAALWLVGVWGGLFAALAWSYTAIARRVVTRRPVPGLLVLGVVGITARTIVAALSGSVFVYFLQPTLTTVLIAGIFLVSVPAGRPLAERLAGDFCPLPDTFVGSPPVRRFFARITLLWAFVQLTNAAVSIWLLVTQPISTYVVARTATSWVLTGAAVVASTLYFRRSMRRHGITVHWRGAPAARAPHAA